MERDSLVRDVLVEHEGTTHQASYFVEAGMIHGRLGEHKFLAPIGADSTDVTVRTLVSEQLLKSHRRLRHSDSWAEALRSKLRVVD